MERKLTTILASDVVGYSALMGDAEETTIQQLGMVSEFLTDQVEAKGGRLFSQAGDGFLCEFSSPVMAVRAGYEIQRDLQALAKDNEQIPALRIGIHMADVVVEGNNLLGDGVNIASRIEGVAEPGNVLVSRTVFDQVKRTAQLRFENCGEALLKNISEPVTLYKVLGDLGNHSMMSGTPENLKPENGSGSAKVAQNSLIVLPFANMSDDKEQEYFSDGFCDDLITELSRFKDLFVISRNASFTYKGRSVDLRDVGREMGVAYCLEGSLRKMGPRARINVQLIQTETGDHVWAEKYDFNFEDVFDVQDELAATITSIVAGRVNHQAEAAAKRKKPSDMAAYDCFLQGMSHHRLGGCTREASEQALHWFDRTIEKDDGFGRAYAWKACALATVGEWNQNTEELWDELCELGQKGVELDNENAECHRIQGSICLYSKRWDEAKYHFERAISLNPNHAFIVGRMGEVYNFIGEPEKALEYQLRATRLDPFLPDYCRELEATSYYLLGEYEKSIEVLHQLTRKTRRASTYAAASSAHLGDKKRSEDLARQVITINPEFSTQVFLSTELYKDETIPKQIEQDLLAVGLPK